MWSSLHQTSLEEYDQIIHLGLGVYDHFDQILIEEGAYNLHRGRDALNKMRDTVINQGKPQILIPPTQVKKGILRAMNTHLPSPFQLVASPARIDNVYLCNATHYRGLNTLLSTHSKLKEVYFLHIPHRQGDSDLPLAYALESIIKALIQ